MARIASVLPAHTEPATDQLRWEDLSDGVANADEFTATDANSARIIRIDIEGDGDADANTVRVLVVGTPDGTTSASAEQLSNNWEDHKYTLRIRVDGLSDLRISGPDHSAHDTRDASAPYTWIPGEDSDAISYRDRNGDTGYLSEWVADFKALYSDDNSLRVALVMDDGGREAGSGITTEMLDSVFAAETDDVFLVLLTLEHPDLTDSIRLVHNKEDIESRSNTYTRFAFRPKFPDNVEGRAPTAQVEMDNVSLEIIREIRQIDTAPTVKLEIIRAADPDVVEMEWPEFYLRNIQWDVATIRGTLTLDNVVQEPFPAIAFTPAYFPGLF